jgi:Carboxypeptidase regulatory-like domain/TonB dependent receptor
LGKIPASPALRRSPDVLLRLAVLAVVMHPSVFAQIDTGAIVGSIFDPSGAAVPKAAITVTNTATHEVLTTVSNSAGQYQFTGLRVGEYTVKATAPGFGAQIASHVQIDVQSRPSIDFNLKIGDASQTVQVESAAPLLNTQTADVGGVVQQQQIRDLPLNGRRYADLALLEPGIQKDPTVSNAAADRFSSNGNLETQNYFSLDGIENNSGSTNLQEGSVQTVQPPPDALSEFRVQTRTYSAEFGTSAGAVINASIKSGTDAFHGDVWEFVRNNHFDSNTFLNNAGGVPRGHFSQNQFGGTIGGPIIKHKTFFFGDAQDFRSSKATTILSTVPTPLMKAGNFTELKPTLAAPGVAGQSGCITGNIIAPSCIDPVGAKLLALYPDPNVPSLVAREGTPGSWTGGSNYQFQYGIPNNTYSWDARVDHNINDNNRIFGRFSAYNVARQDAPWTGNPLAGNGNFATQYQITGKSLALSWTDVLSSGMVNEIRAGFTRDNAHSLPIGVAMGTSAATQFGLTGIPGGPYDAGLPPVNITGLQRLGTAPWRPQVQIAQVWQLLDTLSWLKGNHSLKFGFESRHTSDNFLDAQSLQGQITSSGIYTGNVGLGVADFLLGDVSTASFTTPTIVHNYKQGYSFFAQDTWRVRPNLTINLGLRYELFSPLLNHQNAISNFINGTFVTATSGDWFARGLVHPPKNDFAPRFGFAYQANKKLVLRGGYGIFYQHDVRIGSESVLGENPPAFYDQSLAQSAGSITPAFFLKNGFPATQFGPQILNLTTLQIRAQDPNQRTPYVQQVSFGPQWEISQSTVLDISYVGNFGRKENRLRNANQGIVTGFLNGAPVTLFPYANLSTNVNTLAGSHAYLELATNDGNTNYNGLLVSLKRRFAKGLTFGVSYTFSKNLADFVDNLTGGSTPANAYNYSLERSFSPFDVKHRFVANALYALPIGKGGVILSNNSMASRMIGGWQLNGVLTLQSGLPFSVSAPDASATGGSHASRANCIGDPFAGATTDPTQLAGATAPGFFLNPAAFSLATTGTFGTCAPRKFHGPGIENLDMSIFKSFEVTERYKVEFRSEFFNTFNHVNFGNPSANAAPASLPTFGKLLTTIGDPREIQFALKVYF